MQKFALLINCLFFLNIHLGLVAFSEKSPLLVVTIMIKNEAQVIEATLKPFLQAGQQHFVILDTGSTDDTVKIVQNLFKKYKIQHGHIVQEPFVDFATSRNFALESAEKIFPNAVFFFMIDAEWYMHNVQGLIEFCEKYKDHKDIAYLMKKTFPSDKVTDYINYLFKAHKGVRFYGAVHECINQIAEVKVPNNVFILHNPSKLGREKSSTRWQKDLKILLKEHEKDPNNLRTIFYLGQTYTCLKNYEKALFWYKKRCKGERNNEEKYLAHFRVATIYQSLDNWPEALRFYFKAHAVRPQRIEPLIHIAQYYFNIHNYQATFLLAKYITTLIVPHEEKLCMSPELYTSALYDLLSTTAKHVGEYEIGRQALLKALQSDPFHIRLHNTLRLYEQKLNHHECHLLNRNFWCNWCNGTLWLSRPAWFNFCCLSDGCLKTNRCNFSQGMAWRYWVGPFYL